jgi:hypothetical protein
MESLLFSQVLPPFPSLSRADSKVDDLDNCREGRVEISGWKELNDPTRGDFVEAD